jgi:hypothetical protein
LCHRGISIYIFKKIKKPAKLNLQAFMVMKGRNFDLVSEVLDRSAVSSADHFRGLDAAAAKLQKAYKIYRTRRNLAGCAVVGEELW